MGGLVSQAAVILTKNFVRGDYKHGRAYCGDCRGKGFDCTRGPGERSARMCQRCRGKGYTSCGGTKR